jgi:hypothetical protein
MSERPEASPLRRERSALRFVPLIGVVSLFADISQRFRNRVVAGVGECVGYALRIVFGYLSDRTGRYWPITP